MNQRVSTLSLLLALLSAPCAHAQTQRSGDAQKFMQQYQQLAAEKTSLQAQVAQLKKDLDTAQTAAGALKKERDALKARAAGSAGAAAQLAHANASKESAEKNLEQAKQRTNELITRFKETVGTLKGVESDRDQLRKDNEALGIAFDKCAENNLQLYEISNTVLDRYDHVGLFTRVGTAEPFTKITRTRIENLVDEYRARAQELRVKKRTP
jgi:DNA repair exonuclease SbcCD ATPase subunit